MDDAEQDFEELAELEGIELGEDGRIRAEMVRYARVGRAYRRK